MANVSMLIVMLVFSFLVSIRTMNLNSLNPALYPTNFTRAQRKIPMRELTHARYISA